MPDLDNAPAERVQAKEAAAENTVAQQNIQSQQDGSFSKTFQDQNNATAKASEQMAQNGTIGKMEIGSDPNGKTVEADGKNKDTPRDNLGAAAAQGAFDGAKAMNPAPTEPPRQDQDGERPRDGNKSGKQGAFDGAQAMNPEPKEPPRQDQDGRVTRGQSVEADGRSKDHPKDDLNKDHPRDNSNKGGMMESPGNKLEGGSAQGGAGGKHGERSQPGEGGTGGQIGDRGGRGIGRDGYSFDPRRDLPPKNDDQPQYPKDRNPFNKPTPVRSQW